MLNYGMNMLCILSRDRIKRTLGFFMLKKKDFGCKELVSALMKNNSSLNQERARSLVDSFFEEISVALVCGDRVELRGFGSLSIRKRRAKTIISPRTGKATHVSPKGSVYFRPSKVLLERLNKKKK